jgi:hypothetical protein
MTGRKQIFGALSAFSITGVALLLVGGRLAPDAAPEPRFAVDQTAHPVVGAGATAGTFRVTLDTSDSRHFVPFDLATGQVRPIAASDVQRREGAGLPDLMLRRYSLRAPHGALRLEGQSLSEARLPSVPAAAWKLDEELGGQLQNPVLKDWYRYSYWTHVLRSRGDVYAVRLASGGIAYLKILGYYCEPEGSGCLTLQYRLDLETAQGR